MPVGVVSQQLDTTASPTGVSTSISTALSTAESSVTSESVSISTSESTTLSEVTSLSTSLSADLSMINSLSTVVSASISTDISLINSLSTAVGSGGSAVKGSLFGLTLAPDATSTVLDIAAGNCVDSTAAATLTLGAFTKAIGSAWAAGTGNGSLDTGAIANSTWYHVFVISKAAGANPDVLTSLSATAPTMPSTYTLFRRIGSFLTNGSGQVTPFSQFADEFRWMVQVASAASAPADTSAHLATLATPLGVKTIAYVQVFLDHSGSGGCLVTSPDDTDSAVGTSSAGPFTLLLDVQASNSFINGLAMVRTNLSSQVRYRTSASSMTAFSLATIGWRDDRGRNQ